MNYKEMNNDQVYYIDKIQPLKVYDIQLKAVNVGYVSLIR